MPLIPRLIYIILTLYMLLILLRWFGNWLGFDTEEGRFRWIGAITSPLIQKLRQVLPPLGPIDFAPAAALVVVWLIRELFMGAFVYA